MRETASPQTSRGGPSHDPKGSARSTGAASSYSWLRSVLSGPLGEYLFRPWVDRLGFSILNGITIPLSALWAAAVRADGEVSRFRAEIPLTRPLGLPERWALQRIARAGRTLARADRLWTQAFFADAPAPNERLLRLETARRTAAIAWRTSASGLARLLLPGSPIRDAATAMKAGGRAFPRVRFAIPRPEEVEAAHGARIDSPELAFALPEPLPPITRSKPLFRNGACEYWLRFPSPGIRMGDACFAHVTEPLDGPPDATFVFSSGLGIEADHIPAGLTPLSDFVSSGLRVIELETPWHGRRLPWGYYAGERIFATAPLGALDLFDAMVKEIGVAVAWARAADGRTDARVGIGGVSLGAIAASIALSSLAAWPREARPDAALLIVPGAPLADISFDGAIPKLFGVDTALTAAGWTRAQLDRYGTLTDPAANAMDRPHALPRDRVVCVLASEDDVTGYDRGRRLTEAWQIPPGNVFTVRQGHYSAALSLLVKPEPRLLFQSLLGCVAGDPV